MRGPRVTLKRWFSWMAAYPYHDRVLGPGAIVGRATPGSPAPGQEGGGRAARHRGPGSTPGCQAGQGQW
eukprot:1862178-Lingulodinium_polyedra.AAC.1